MTKSFERLLSFNTLAFILIPTTILHKLRKSHQVSLKPCAQMRWDERVSSHTGLHCQIDWSVLWQARVLLHFECASQPVSFVWFFLRCHGGRCLIPQKELRITSRKLSSRCGRPPSTQSIQAQTGQYDHFYLLFFLSPY